MGYGGRKTLMGFGGRDPHAPPNPSQGLPKGTLRRAGIHSPAVRIAYITHYAELYGANRSMLDLLLELRRRGEVTPFVLLPREGPLTEKLAAEHVPFAVIPWQPWMSD